MIQCIIIDDEPKAIDILKRYISKVSSLELRGDFRDSLTALEFLKKEKIDLIFLDINIPHLNGIQFLKIIDTKPMVIFTTAYSDYAIESYELNALDYMLKPITFERFLKAINKVQDLKVLKNAGGKLKDPKSINDNEFILVKSGPQTHQIKLEDILYLEKEGNYLTIYLKDRKLLIRENMSAIFDLIPHQNFIRVHKSFVVNIKHIEIIENHQITMGRAKIPLGATFKEDFYNRIKEIRSN